MIDKETNEVAAMKLARDFIQFNTGSSHYVIEQLDKALAQSRSDVKQEVDSADSAAWRLGYDAGVARQEAIYESAKQEQNVSVGEPVAEVKQNSSGQIYIDWREGESAIVNLVGAKLYTTPQPVMESHKRKPLTFEQVEACFQDGGIWGVDGKHLGTTAQGLHDFARAIEAAHGIKE